MEPLPSPFTDADFDELAAWLERRPKGIQDIVELEGFLTALVIGPNLVQPAVWLPKVWGGRKSNFKDPETLNRFVTLVVGLHNDLAAVFDQAPEQFHPTFYESTVDGRRIQIVDEWCFGFLKGMRMDPVGWKPLKKERPDLLKPLQLFGSPAGWKEMEAGGDEVMHRRWSPQITPAVRAIHAYWLPHRIAEYRQVGNATLH
jgi:uncharacterized protein